MGLFKPGWMSEEYKKASASLKKVSDETVLRDAAMRAPNRYVREEAVKRLWDCMRLIEVINGPGISVPREAAIKRLMAVEPLYHMWDGLDKMDKEAVVHDARLQSCLAVIARYAEGYGIRRKAAMYLTDQVTLKHLGMNDWDQGVRRIALERIDDQQYLQAVFDAADSDEIRMSAIINMRDTGRAAKLARAAREPNACIKAIRKAGDPAVALEIMAQTLYQSVLSECTRLVSLDDIKDDWRLAVVALCGPEESREQAKRRIQDCSVFERIAGHDCLERFSSPYGSSYLCEKSLEFVSGDDALLRVHHGAKDRDISEKALLRIGRLDTMLSLFEGHPLRYSGRKFFERLDVMDGEWVQMAGSRTVEGLAGILSENTKDERFDYTHIANALRRIYGNGRATGRIAGLKGIAVSHSDSSGRVNRDKGCHEDGGFTYLELDDIKPEIAPVIFKLRNNRDADDALQDLQAVTSQAMLKDIALDGDVSSKIRAAAARRITDEYTLLSVALEIELPEKQDISLDAIKDPDMLLLVAGDAKMLRIRKQALQFITDEQALFRIASANIPESFTREICERLDELDADWAQQLNDAAVKALISVIANNKKDEQFDYRHFVAALKSIYRQGRSKAAIERLDGRAVAHLDYTGKEYRDKWCHQDGDYIYLALLEQPEKAALEAKSAGDHDAPNYEVGLKKQMDDLGGIKNQNKLKAIALDKGILPQVRTEAFRRITDEDMLLGVALEIEIPDVDLKRIADKDKLLTIAHDAKSPQMRVQALELITDAKALFRIVSANIPESFTREICKRLDELDADWAQQLDDAAVKTLTSIIESNKKDEQFDYRHYADALKSVYRQGQSRETIKKLDGKAVAHLDYTGKEYRDKWCHQDEGCVYFDLRDTVLAGIDDPEKLKAIARDKAVPDSVRAEAAQRTADGDALFSVALEAEAGSDILNRIKDPDKWLALVRGAESPKVRQWAVQQVTDTDALLTILSSDILRYCTPEICARLDTLDTDWARRLDNAAVAEMISIIANNEKDERFDYRPVATALKRVYAAGRFSGAIEGLDKKAVSHADVQGKAYRDEWCHMDEGYTYFTLVE